MNLAALVQPRRLLSDLEVLARISEPGEGVTRLGYSSQEREAHAWLTSRVRDAGLLPDPDGPGNRFGWLTPPDGRPVLLTGSHLDSVPHGGRFDGALGVLAALEVLRAWKEAGRLPGAPAARAPGSRGRADPGERGLRGKPARGGRGTDQAHPPLIPPGP